MNRKIVGVGFSIIIMFTIWFPEWFTHIPSITWLQLIALMVAVAFIVDWK